MFVYVYVKSPAMVVSAMLQGILRKNTLSHRKDLVTSALLWVMLCFVKRAESWSALLVQVQVHVTYMQIAGHTV